MQYIGILWHDSSFGGTIYGFKLQIVDDVFVFVNVWEMSVLETKKTKKISIKNSSISDLLYVAENVLRQNQIEQNRLSIYTNN